ncbi:hypothetical protein [Halobellus ruber]|uniref:Uncharacterized protein n=1 Tax=Halobellus ruber TaxID=2761102 RepID=A0A7J9SLI6_9EURY|nr:hypothetical protein [Halobellus ruber]MBB6647785.1 hypothetical protein [Halobellus ruber]
MSREQPPSNPDHSTDTWSLLTGAIPRQAAFTVIILCLVAVQPAAAQSNAVCSADNLPSMIEGFFQLTTALGIVGLAIVWQADSLIEMFTLNPEQKKGLKRHKRSAMKSAVVLVVLGPLYTVAGSTMSLPLAQCVNLAPW